MGHDDVVCCVQQFLLPARLWHFFCTPAIAARRLPGRLHGRFGAGPDTLVRFQCRVVPMGWAWA
eukprot:11155077-Lingulodinium_polyedra.AAC.1